MRTLAFFLICLVHFRLAAQEWVDMARSGYTFSQIENAMNQIFKGKSVENATESYKLYKRWAAFWMHRTTKEGKLGHPTLMWEAIKHRFHNARTETSDWAYFGPDVLPTSASPGYPGAGRINAIAFAPEDHHVIWAGSPTGGLWKSTNGGANWIPLGDGLPNMGVSDIAIDPSAPDIMYLATGDAPGKQNYSIGILKSLDGGISWDTTGLTFPLNKLEFIFGIYLDQSNPSRLLAAASDGIYKTTDAGISWHKVDSLPSYQILQRPLSVDTLYSSGKNEVRMSTNQGDTWASIGPPLHGNRVVIAVTPQSPAFILALDADGNLFKTHNAGVSWAAVNFPIFSSQMGYNMALAISPSDTNLMLVGGVDAWRSTNGGASWEKYLNGTGPFGGTNSFYVHQDHHVFKFLPDGSNILFSGNDGGLNKGDLSSKKPWEDLSQGLFITQYYGIGGSPAHGNLLLAGARDNDINMFNGSRWVDLNNNSDGVDGMYNYLDTSISYASSQFGFLTKTTNSWNTSDTLNVPGKASYVWPMSMNRLNPNTIYVGTDDLHVSYDAGANWTNLTKGKTFHAPILEIGLSPTDTNVIYTSYSSILLVSTDHGASWNYQSGPNDQNITGIAVSDTDPQTIYVTVSGFNVGEKVFVSHDGGGTWINISGTLPNVSVNCIVLETGSNQDLYVGTDIGVYHTNKFSNDFAAYKTGLPNVIVNDIEIIYATNKIRIGTFGRGVWETDLASIVGQEDIYIKNKLNVKLSPNPVVDYISIEIKGASDGDSFDLKVYNLAGGIVCLQNALKKGGNAISLPPMSDGIYMANITSGKKHVSIKFVKI